MGFQRRDNRLIKAGLELVRLMRNPETGVPLKAVKSFLSRIPDVFTGEDLVTWLRKTYDIDSADEAIHLGEYIKISHTNFRLRS